MFKAFATTTLIASTIALAVPTAKADAIVFDFSSAGAGSIVFTGDNRAYRDTVSGVTLTVRGVEVDTPSNFNNNAPGANINGETYDREPITRDTSGTNQGLGIDSDGDQSNSQFDGNDGGSDDIELAFFSFTDAMGAAIEVQLLEIVFNNADSDDDFGLSTFDNILLVDQSIAPAPGSSSFAYDFTLLDLMSSSFGVFADSGNAGNGENFKVRSFTVTTVSEPATLALLGFGMAGFAAMNRRKR